MYAHVACVREGKRDIERQRGERERTSGGNEGEKGHRMRHQQGHAKDQFFFT